MPRPQRSAPPPSPASRASRASLPALPPRLPAGRSAPASLPPPGSPAPAAPVSRRPRSRCCRRPSSTRIPCHVPGHSGRDRAAGAAEPGAVKPRFHGVLAYWKRGFTTFRWDPTGCRCDHQRAPRVSADAVETRVARGAVTGTLADDDPDRSRGGDRDRRPQRVSVCHRVPCLVLNVPPTPQAGAQRTGPGTLLGTRCATDSVTGLNRARGVLDKYEQCSASIRCRPEGGPGQWALDFA